MSLARQIRRLQKKVREAMARKKRRKALLEPLEPRILLSADLKFSMTGGVDDVTLRKEVEATDAFGWIDDRDQSVLMGEAFVETGAMEILGSEYEDSLSIDDLNPFDMPVLFSDGSAGDGDLPLQTAGGVDPAGIVDIADGSPVQSRTQADLPLVASDSSIPPAAQIFFLDFDGAVGITYEGPVTVDGIDVSGFKAPDHLIGLESEIIDALVNELGQAFEGWEILFTALEPSYGAEFSTIYIGDAGEAFAEYGPFMGLSEKIDKGNADPTDIAFIFPEEIQAVAAGTPADYGRVLAGYVAHEAGHLMGWEHAYEVEPQNPLAAVAWKPYVHNETAKDVRDDLIEDGKVTVQALNDQGEVVGEFEYDVHPRIVEAITRYPAFYYAGSVGPDGFPELIMGQMVLHAMSAAVWVGHILDKAWEAQTDDSYTEVEKLQVLAWAYGYPAHVAGDLWCHTLVNEFSTGPWPELMDILNFNEEPKYAASVIKHLLIEGYLADATPGFDHINAVNEEGLPDEAEGEVERTLLPTGDVSSDSTPTRELDVVSRFLYNAMILDIPDLPGQMETLLKAIPEPSLSDISHLTDGTPSLTGNLKNEFGDYILVSDPVITEIETNVWRIKSDYTDFILRLETKTKIAEDGSGTQTPVSELSLYRVEKSRGALINSFISLHDLLVQTARDVLGSPYAGSPGADYQPLAELIDPLIEAGNRLLRGDDLDGLGALDQAKDDVLEKLTGVADRITDSVKTLYGKISSGKEVTGEDVTNLANALVGPGQEAAADYLHYWIYNIEVGLRHWGDLGLALSRALFDPQSKRDVQNEEGASYGADVADPDFLYLDRRADAESDVGILGVIFSELDDPNNDQATKDSFINQYLLPMFGVPHKMGELRTEMQGFLTAIETQIMEPTRELLGDLNPLDPILDFVKEKLKEYAKEILRDAVMDLFGFDIELFEYLDSLSAGKMDIKSIEVLYPEDLVGLGSSGTSTRITWEDHGLEVGDRVVFTNIETGPWSILNVDLKDPSQAGHLVTSVIDESHFLIGVDSRTWGDYQGAADPGKIGRFAKFDLFKSTDREKVDEYLGFGSSDIHHPFPHVDEYDNPDYVQVHTYGEDGRLIRTVYHEGALGGLLENIEYDKEKFAAYANTVTLGKLLLLQEEDPLSGAQPKNLSRFASDFLTQAAGTPLYYDFANPGITLNGNHGGDILTATLNGVLDAYGRPVGATSLYPQPIWGDLWLTTIDGDHAWRQDSAATFNRYYRFQSNYGEWGYEEGQGENTVTWTFEGLAAGQYRVYADWLSSIYQFPTQTAPYEIRVNNVKQGTTVLVDQTTAPDDVEFYREIGSGDTLKAWPEPWERLEPLGPGVAITLASPGKLQVVLSDAAYGDVIAGRIRIEKVGDPSFVQIITNKPLADLVAPEVPGYAESPKKLFDFQAPWIDELNGGTVPQGLLDLFVQNGISDSYFSKHDFTDDSIPIVLANVPMVFRLVLSQFSLPSGATEVAQDAIDEFNALIAQYGDYFKAIFGVDPAGLIDTSQIKAFILSLDFDPVSKYLWGRLSDTARSTFMSYTSDPEVLLRPLAEELNEIIKTDTGLYNASRFAGVLLSPDAAGLLSGHLDGSHLTGERLLRLNRLLLEDVYREEVARSLPESFAVRKVTEAGQDHWIVRRIDKVHATVSNKIEYKEQYSIVQGTKGVSTDWQDITYAMGTGNFPIWESESLREDVFRKVFKDWENYGECFPPLGDEPTSDTHVTTTPILYGAFPAYTAPTPSLVAPSGTVFPISIDMDGRITGVITDAYALGTSLLPYSGDVVLGNIMGNSSGGADSLTLYIGGNVLIEGFVGGGGLTHITIEAGGTITLQGRTISELGDILVEKGAVLSSRQVAPGANHWDAVSTGPSGNIVLKAGDILVGADASILAHVDQGSLLAAGSVELTAYEEIDETWSFLGIDGFNWRQTEAGIELGMGARLTGADIALRAETLTRKTLNGMTGDEPEFSFTTRAVVLGDVNHDGWMDMVVGNDAQPDRLYLNDGTGNLGNGREINADKAYKTTSLALGNVDGDPELELIVGTDDDDILLFHFTDFNVGTGEFTSSFERLEDADTATTSLALGDVDADGDLDLVVGVGNAKDRLYLNNGGGGFSLAGGGFGDASVKTTSLALANLDADAQLELVVGTEEHGVLVYDYSGGNYAAATLVSATDTWKITSLALGNLDGDPTLELVVGTEAHGVKLLQQSGAAFTSITEIAGGAYLDAAGVERPLVVTDLAIGDVDHDGDLDLVVGNWFGPSRLYLNSGSGLGAGQNITGDDYGVTAVALGKISGPSGSANDDLLELVLGVDRQPILYYTLDTLEDSTGGSATGYLFGSEIGVDPRLSRAASSGDNLDFSTDKAKAVVGEADSSILIGAGAVVLASHDVQLGALAKSNVEIITVRSGWGVTYGNSTARADVVIQNGATIVAGNWFNMEARSENTLNVLTFIPAVGESTNLALSLATGHSHSLAEIRSGAWVEAHHADVLAKNLNAFSNTAIAAGFGTEKAKEKDTLTSEEDDTGIGATLALSFLQSYATASVSGLLRVAGDMTVKGESINTPNITRSFASVSGNPLGRVADEVKGFMGGILLATEIGRDVAKWSTGETKDAYAVALSVVTSDNKANALIGQAANLVVGGNLHVLATATDTFQISASGSAGALPGSDLDSAWGGAFAYTKTLNQANAFIGWNAVVDVAKNLRVFAHAVEQSPVDALDLTLALLGLGENTQTEGIAAAYGYSEKMGGRVANAMGSPLFEEEDFENVFSLRTLLLDTANNEVSRYLWDHHFTSDTRTLLNNPGATESELRSALKGEFNRLIQNGLSLYTMKQPSPNEEESIFEDVSLRDDTQALRDQDPAPSGADLVRLNRMLLEDAYPGLITLRKNVLIDLLADNLNDEAKTGTSFTYAGGSAASGGTAVGGAINWLFTYNGATAGIAKGSLVNQRSHDLWADTSLQDVDVLATADLESYNFAGNASVLNLLTNQSETGVGGFIDAIINQSSAKAYIDDLAVVSAARNIQVKADSNIDLVTVVMAGGYAEKTSVDGAFIYNRINNMSQAYIEDRATVEAGENLTIEGLSDIRSVAVTPALAVGGQYGVGVSASFNHVIDHTRAFVGDSRDRVCAGGYGGVEGSVTAGNDVTVYARSTPQIWAIGASAGIAPGGTDSTDNGAMEGGMTSVPDSGEKFGLGFSGSVAFNWVDTFTRAFVADGVSVEVGNHLGVEAYSDPLLVAGAGGFAFGNDWGIGGAYAHNTLEQTTRAFITNATVESGTIEIRAHTDNKIIGVAASGAGAKDDGAIAGAVNLNFLTHEVGAFVGDDAVLSTTDLSVRAENSGLLVSVAGVLGIGVNGAFAAGADVSLSFVESNVYAYLGSLSEITGANARVFASNDTEIIAVSAALAISTDGIGASGSAASVNLDHNVQSFIADKDYDVLLGSMDCDQDGVISRQEFLARAGGTGAAGAFIAADTNLDGYLSSAEYLAHKEMIDAETKGRVALSGSLYLDADDETNLVVIAGAVGGGTDAGVGLSAANVNIPERTVKAYIGQGARVDAKGNGAGILDPGGKPFNAQAFGGPGITLDATVDDTLLVFAGGGAGADTFAGAGSAVVITMGTTQDATETYVGKGALINATDGNAGAHTNQSVRLRAENDTFILSVAGSLSGAGTAALGLAANVMVMDKTVKAHIDPATWVYARKDVIVSALSIEEILAIGAAGSAAGTAGIAGSASALDLETTTRAYVAGTPGGTGAWIDALGDVTVHAEGTLDVTLIAGSIGAGGTAGVGASNTTLLHADTVEAYVGEGATVTTGGATGLSVRAYSAEDIISIAVAGTGGGTAGVAGSAVVTDLDETTRAFIGRSAHITAGNAGVNAPGVTVSAADATTIVSVAGSLAAAGTAAVGLGADVGLITKRTEAFIDSNVTADVEKDILITSSSSEDVTSVAAGMGVSGTVSVALDASVHLLDVKTRAFIGDDPSDNDRENPRTLSAGPGDVHAGGNILIDANDASEMDKIVGVLAVAGSAGVGAAGAVTIVDKTTEAFIGAGAKVTADGNSANVTVKTGAFTPGVDTSAAKYDPNNAGGEGVQTSSLSGTPTDSSALKGQGEIKTPQLQAMDPNQNGSNDLTDGSFSGQRILTSGTGVRSGFRGLSVTAMNRDDIETFTISVAGGTAGVAISAGVNVVDTTTSATIGQDAKINEDLATANAAQSVHVAAGNDFYHMAVAGTLGVGVVGVSPAVGVTILSNTTGAGISAGAVVNAKNDVTVEAHGREDLLLVGFGIAAGLVGIGGAVDVLTIGNTTVASIGDATVRAGGDVLVLATDDTDVDIVSGALAAGFVGVGASVGVMVIDKDTKAFIDDNARVDALGAGDIGFSGVLNGTMTGDGDNFGTSATAVHGLVVQAQSSEEIFHLAVAAGVGFVGVSGGVAVTLIDSDTSAYIGADARINQSDPDMDGIINEGADPDQSVYVNASNKVRVTSFAGALAAGFVGVGGAVDVGSIKNDVSAKILGGAHVAALKDVEVNALGIKELDGFTVSGAGGFVGLTASVSVWSVGTPIEKNYSDSDGKSDNAVEGDNGSADQDAANQAWASQSQVSSLLGGYDDGDTTGGEGGNTERVGSATGSAAARLSGAGKDSTYLVGRVNDSGPTIGTVAGIESGALIVAGEDIEVTAMEDMEVDITAGAFAAGAVGVGASIVVTNLAANATAYASGTLVAGRNIAVSAILDDDVNIQSYTGAAGFVGLGASVVVIHDASTTTACIGDNADILYADSVSVSAASDQAIYGFTGQLSVGALGAGASFVTISVGNGGAVETLAYIGNNVDIGQSTGTVGSVSVSADSKIRGEAETWALAGGIGAFSVNGAHVSITPEVQAYIGTGSRITVSGDVRVAAVLTPEVRAEGFGINVGVVGAGASTARAAVFSTVTAGAGGTITAGGLTVEAIQKVPASNRSATALATGSAGGFLVGLNSTSSSALSSGTVRGYVADDSTLHITGGTTVTASNATRQYADADSNAGGLLAVGVSSSSASSDTNTEAYLGFRVKLTGGSLTVRATGEDDNLATTTAGSVGAIAGASASAEDHKYQQHNRGDQGRHDGENH